MICSIVRTVEPGAVCSHPVGRREVYFLAPYLPCLHSYETSHDVRLSMRGRTWEETQKQASELAETFRNCCYVAGINYHVEEIDEDSTERAPV
jgi:hypothetical protein